MMFIEMKDNVIQCIEPRDNVIHIIFLTMLSHNTFWHPIDILAHNSIIDILSQTSIILDILARNSIIDILVHNSILDILAQNSIKSKFILLSDIEFCGFSFSTVAYYQMP